MAVQPTLPRSAAAWPPPSSPTPVVLVVVQNGQQHVQVGKQVPKPNRRREAHTEVRAGAPLGKALVPRNGPQIPTAIAQGFEQPPDEVRAFPRGHDGDPGFQGDGPCPPVPVAPGCAPRARCRTPRQSPRSGVTTRRRGGRSRIAQASRRPWMHRACGRTSPTGSMCSSSATVQRVAFRLGIEDIGPPEREFERLKSAGILVYQESQIGRRPMRGGDGEQHYANGCTGNAQRTMGLYAAAPATKLHASLYAGIRPQFTAAMSTQGCSLFHRHEMDGFEIAASLNRVDGTPSAASRCIVIGPSVGDAGPRHW